jgi:hypothetical protein
MAKHKLDELFSEGLKDFTPTPAPAAWEQIENQLDQKSRKAYWAWAGIAVTAALLFASSWLMFTQNETTESYAYDYAEVSPENITQPAEDVYVPIYIYTPARQPASVTEQSKPFSVVKRDTEPVQEQPVVLAQTKELPVEQPEIIPLEEVPMVTAEEVLMATADTQMTQEPASLEPVTIIYKQGEPAEESNFIKAMNYMEEVRMGEKKLLNFDKLRENIRSRFRAEEGTD